MKLPLVPDLPASFFLALAWGVALASALGQERVAGDVTIPVDSPAFVFSPGNWVGDQGRGGALFRQTWNSGAYFRVTWSTTSATPTAQILFDTKGLKEKPDISYSMDGIWTDAIVGNPASLLVQGLKGSGAHTLIVYVKRSDQADRWGSSGTSGGNFVRVKGVQVDASSTPGTGTAGRPWALIIGDSITEGILADDGSDDNLACWSYLVGQGLQARGYEYGVSACGYSGWIRPGDATHDVPPYYMISGSSNGIGGTYGDDHSRWNKVDGNNHSLLDANGHLSAFGGTGQEPALILINYGTNDGLSHVASSDIQASITQSLGALRKAAPDAVIDLIVPFGQYTLKELQQGVAAYQSLVPNDRKVALIDLGPTFANTLASTGAWGGLHPNLRGHANFAGRILALIGNSLPPESP